MAFKPHPPSAPLLVGYDPHTEIGEEHLARFIDAVVESAPCPEAPSGPGQPGYHPKMLAKISMYAYTTGVHSSRRIEQNCNGHLAYMYLARDDRPCYRTICDARTDFKAYFEQIWLHLLVLGSANGIKTLGRISIDSTKFKADCSEDLIIDAKEYDAVLARLREHLDLAQQTDAREDEEGQSVRTSIGVSVRRLQMRAIVRSVGEPAAEGEITPRMRARIESGIQTLEQAKEDGRNHVSLSDPDARMMPIGAGRRIAMGHMFEVAADGGLLVAGGSCNAGGDTGRLMPLLDEAQKNDPVPVTSVSADSGYFEGGTIAKLLATDLDVVIPDATTAGAMRRPEPEPKDKIEFTKIEGRNAYICPEGNVLTYKDGWDSGGQRFTQYKTKNICTDCPLADRCLSKPTNKYRYINIQQYGAELKDYLAGFKDPEIRKAYYARGPAIETIFAVLRTTMQFSRWTVRGDKKVASEASLLKVSFQARKIHTQMRGRRLITA